jgi:hypothetical protein
MPRQVVLGNEAVRWHSRTVIGLQWFIGLGSISALALFSVVFRRVQQDLVASQSRGVPMAVVARGGGVVRADEGSWRERIAASMPSVQAGIVATAATSILVMALCLTACLVLAVVGG